MWPVTTGTIPILIDSIRMSSVDMLTGIFIPVTPGHKIGEISLENIHITLPGGGSAEQAKLVIPEDEKRYPEFSFFGVLPAYGLMARHLESLDISQVEFSLEDADERKPFLYLDMGKTETIKK